MMKYIFLDIDGVLNTPKERHENGYHSMRRDLVERMNGLIQETDARLVITSAWRYSMLMGFWNLIGLENCLLTHGLDCHNRIVGITEFDYCAPSRGQLISRWLAINTIGTPRYVIFDNGGSDPHDNLGIVDSGHENHFVWVSDSVGLTDKNIKAAKFILTGEYPG